MLKQTVRHYQGIALETASAKPVIRCNCIAPGPVWTPLVVSSFPTEKVCPSTHLILGEDRDQERRGAESAETREDGREAKECVVHLDQICRGRNMPDADNLCKGLKGTCSL